MLLMEKKNPTKPKYVFHTGRILYKGIAMQKDFFFSRPFSEFLGHGCYMCCLLEIEKEKQLCLGWR